MTNEKLFALVKRVDPQAVRLPPGLVAIAAEIEAVERERIADLWAGCTTDAEGHGLVDIGASIRAGRLIDEA